MILGARRTGEIPKELADLHQESTPAAGLKIPWGSPPVRVRFPPPAPAKLFYTLALTAPGTAPSPRSPRLNAGTGSLSMSMAASIVCCATTASELNPRKSACRHRRRRLVRRPVLAIKRRTCYDSLGPMAVRACTVSFKDLRGIRNGVGVEAESGAVCTDILHFSREMSS